MRRAIALLLAMGLLAGPASPAEAEAVSPTEAVPFRDLLLSLNATLRQQVATDDRFSAEQLRAATVTELQKRGLLGAGAGDAGQGDAADILVDAFSVQPSGNVVLFGRIPSTGTLAGLVRILDADGREQRNFKVRAEAALNLSRDGKDKNPLRPLYREFAAKVADGLALR